MRKVTFFCLLTALLVLLTGQVAAQNQRPSRPSAPTRVTPTPGGGATIWRPGQSAPTRVTPTPGGGATIWEPGQSAPKRVTPTPGGGYTVW